MSIFGSADRDTAAQLYQRAKGIGQAFLEDAFAKGMVSKLDPMLSTMLHPPDAALRLGYVLSAAAYALRPDARSGALSRYADWYREVLARQQLAAHQRMSRLFARTMVEKGHRPIPYMPPTPSEREPMRELVNSRAADAKKTVDAIVAAVRAGAASPLAAAYDDLVGCFGGRGEEGEYERRYGATLKRLFADVRGDAPPA